MDRLTHLWIFNFNCPKMLFLPSFPEQREKFWKRFERRTRRLHTERSYKICSKTARRLFSNVRTNFDSGAIREKRNGKTCTYRTHTRTRSTNEWGTFNLFTKLEKNMYGTDIHNTTDFQRIIERACSGIHYQAIKPKIVDAIISDWVSYGPSV